MNASRRGIARRTTRAGPLTSFETPVAWHDWVKYLQQGCDEGTIVYLQA